MMKTLTKWVGTYTELQQAMSLYLCITRNLRQNGGRPDSAQTFRSLRMAADRYREMYGEN